jgi:hypothetical protein
MDYRCLDRLSFRPLFLRDATISKNIYTIPDGRAFIEENQLFEYECDILHAIDEYILALEKATASSLSDSELSFLESLSNYTRDVHVYCCTENFEAPESSGLFFLLDDAECCVLRSSLICYMAYELGIGNSGFMYTDALGLNTSDFERARALIEPTLDNQSHDKLFNIGRFLAKETVKDELEKMLDDLHLSALPVLISVIPSANGESSKLWAVQKGFWAMIPFQTTTILISPSIDGKTIAVIATSANREICSSIGLEGLYSLDRSYAMGAYLRDALQNAVGSSGKMMIQWPNEGYADTTLPSLLASDVTQSPLLYTKGFEITRPFQVMLISLNADGGESFHDSQRRVVESLRSAAVSTMNMSSYETYIPPILGGKGDYDSYTRGL